MNVIRSILRTKLSTSGGEPRRSSRETSTRMTLRAMSLKVKDIKMMIMISRLGASRRSFASQTTMMRRVRMRMVLTMAGAYGPTLLTSSTQRKEPTLSNRVNRNLSQSQQSHNQRLRGPRAKLKLRRQQSKLMLNLSQNQLKHSKKRRKSLPLHRLKSKKATI